MPQANPCWTFLKKGRGVKRDPFEGEFFKSDAENEEVYKRTDSLVREAIQNALDARAVGSSDPIKVRFHISGEGETVSKQAFSPLLRGLLVHLTSLGSRINSTCQPEAMRFLVYEDFNTRGLCGDTRREEDPDESWNEPEDFYWFWWNVGRSRKAGRTLGRWGLGKTVFHSTSEIASIFAVTRRQQPDTRKLLMGQCVTKLHKVDGITYQPEGFFHDATVSDDILQPLDDANVIAEFESLFGLRRGTDFGTSIVVPFCPENLRASEIARSAIVHFFFAILDKKLEVEVSGPDLALTHITAATIDSIAGSLCWDAKSKGEKKHASPPLDLARWAIRQHTEGIASQLNCAGTGRDAPWSAGLWPESLVPELRRKYTEGNRIALRVPLRIIHDDERSSLTHFDVFVDHRESDQEQPSDDYFVREYMTISKIATLGNRKNTRAILLVDDDLLSSFLGDAEGPAHEDWSGGEDRPDRKYLGWKERVSFVKRSIGVILDMLSDSGEEVNYDLLADVFSVEDKRGRHRKGRRDKKPTTTIGPSPPPPVVTAIHKRWYEAMQITGGFRIHPTGLGTPEIGASLAITAAYDLTEESPFLTWSAFDFSFDDKRGNPIRIEGRGVEIRQRTQNTIQLVITSDDFRVDITGFNPLHDVRVNIVKKSVQVDSESEEVAA